MSAETGVLRWEEPPKHGNTGKARSRFNALAEALTSAPGRWAVVAEGVPTGSAASLASRIRAGRGAFSPRGSFESRCVGPTGGPSTVYARYVGEEPSHA